MVGKQPATIAAADANDAALRPGSNGDVRVLNSKKAYFWSTLGDWSARLRYVNLPKD